MEIKYKENYFRLKKLIRDYDDLMESFEMDIKRRQKEESNDQSKIQNYFDDSLVDEKKQEEQTQPTDGNKESDNIDLIDLDIP